MATNIQKIAKQTFFNYLTNEMIRDLASSFSDGRIPDYIVRAHINTVEMIIGDEIINPASVYSADIFFDMRERGKMALPWHKSDSRQMHLADVMECLILRHREIHNGESYADRIKMLQAGMTGEEIKMIEVVALGFWNA
jgi:hypothetical protein